jgi:hypothetical protein
MAQPGQLRQLVNSPLTAIETENIAGSVTDAAAHSAMMSERPT